MKINRFRSTSSFLFFDAPARRVSKIIFFLLAWLLPLAPSETRAQAPEFGANEKDERMISVPVSVSDREGRYISNLKKDDFTIYQNGVKQKISFFARYDEPLSVALLLDTSGSTRQSLKEIKDAAANFIELLNTNDQCQLVTFDARVNVLSEFTADKKTLKKSLDKAQTTHQDGTLMRSAVRQIAESSFDKVQGRKVIVLLSDGKDRGSQTTKDELLSLFEESDILIYTVHYKSGEGFQQLVIGDDGTVREGKKTKKEKKPKAPKKPKGYVVFIPAPIAVPTKEEMSRREKDADVEGVTILRELSDTTAGRFYASGTTDLSETFKKVANELRRQYRLGYRSQTPADDARVYDITVKVARADVAVRTRGRFRAKQL